MTSFGAGHVDAGGVGNIRYTVTEKQGAIGYGGIGAIHTLAKRIGLVKGIDKHLHLLKRHLPYHESDHVLNIAYNVLAGGEGFEDIELLRQNEGLMDAIGAEMIPDPTTAGDFVRRFSVEEVMTLMEVINETRRKVWEVQPREFFKKAILNVDGTIAETTGECKEGMDISHKGIWGYGPLIISLGCTAAACFSLLELDLPLGVRYTPLRSEGDAHAGRTNS